MKLSYSNSYNHMNKFALGLLMFWLIVLILIHPSVLEFETEINIMFIVIEIITVLGIIYQIYSIKKEKKLRNEEIWKNGEKCVGYIVDIGYIRTKRGFEGRTIEKVSYPNYNIEHSIIEYYITVLYNDSYCVDIKSINYDKAYKLVGMLLNPYPIKEKIEIPIDVYIYKNKVYADLNSTELSQVKGYEEYKKILENEYN